MSKPKLYQVGDVVTLVEDHPPKWERMFPCWRSMKVTGVRIYEGNSQSLSVEGTTNTISNCNVRLAEGPW